MKIINMLTNVQTREVSLVRRGANNKRFALTKEQPDMKFAELLQTVLKTKAEGEDALLATLKAAGASDDAVEVAVANFRLQSGFKDKLSKEEFAAVAKAAGFDVTKAAPEPGVNPFATDEEKEKAKKKKAEDEMPADLKKQFDEQAAKMEALEKEAKEKDQRIAKIEKDAALKVYIAKCASDFSHVPGMTHEEMGDMLQKAYEVSDDFGKRLEKQWSETSVAIKKSTLLAKQGVTHGDDGAASAWGKMEAVAKELRAKDPTLDGDTAIAKAMELNPELYQEYLNENPRQRGG